MESPQSLLFKNPMHFMSSVFRTNHWEENFAVQPWKNTCLCKEHLHNNSRGTAKHCENVCEECRNG